MTLKLTRNKPKSSESYLELDETLANWGEKFDSQDFEGKRIMLYNAIERINVFGEYAEIIYNVRLRAYSSGIKQITAENAGNVDMNCASLSA